MPTDQEVSSENEETTSDGNASSDESDEDEELTYDSNNDPLANLESRVIDPEKDFDKSVVRFWGGTILSKNEKLRLHVITDPEREVIPEHRFEYQHVDEGGISLFPRSSCDEFLESFDPYQNQGASGECPVSVDDLMFRMKMFMASENNMSTFHEFVKNSYENKLESYLSDMLREIFPDEIGRSWIYARLAPSRGVSKKQSSIDMDGDGNQQGSIEEEIDEDEDLSDQLREKELPTVSVVTNVVSGTSVVDLERGDGIKVRLKGKEVNQLPDDKRDDRQPGVSVPFQGKVIYTEENPELPYGISGDPEEMLEIVVDVDNGGYGRGFVHRNENIETGESESSDSGTSSNLSIHLMISAVVLILAALSAYLLMP